MKALVIGTGSIGRRHAANLQSLGHDVVVFSERFSLGQPHSLPSSLKCVGNWDSLLEMNFDLAVIANRTDQHVASAAAALQCCNALYIEKPLGAHLEGLAELGQLCQKRRSVIELGFMMRFHPNLKWIKQFLQSNLLGEVVHLRASVGQWLPDWRPGTDHRQGFGAFYRYGGGVTMELIHEIDIVNWLLGDAIDVCAMQRPLPQLEIETEAIAEICLRLSSGLLAQVHLDYVRPGYGRSLEIMGTEAVLAWDYSESKVTVTNAKGIVIASHHAPAFERNAMFLEAMQHFVDRVMAPDMPSAASLDDGIRALRVALASHQSSRERRFVRPQDVAPNYRLTGDSI
jgi:predicted dehydrogenase